VGSIINVLVSHNIMTYLMDQSYTKSYKCKKYVDVNILLKNKEKIKVPCANF